MREAQGISHRASNRFSLKNLHKTPMESVICQNNKLYFLPTSPNTQSSLFIVLFLPQFSSLSFAISHTMSRLCPHRLIPPFFFLPFPASSEYLPFRAQAQKKREPTRKISSSLIRNSNGFYVKRQQESRDKENCELRMVSRQFKSHDPKAWPSSISPL